MVKALVGFASEFAPSRLLLTGIVNTFMRRSFRLW